MAIEGEVPFPQANDLDKIMLLINVENEEYLFDDAVLGEKLGSISDRQARYYITGARYLDIIDEDRHFTTFGMFLRKNNESRQIIELIRRILLDPIFGMVFLSEKQMGIKYTKYDIAEMIAKERPGYADEIYIRRGQTVKTWVLWINKQLNLE